MSITGLDVFDRTVHETNAWLKSVMAKLPTEDRHVAYIALRATLHVLRDRIGPANAVHLGAQLPMLLRGLYYEGWNMAARATRERHKDAYMEHMRQELNRRTDIEPEQAVRAVFEVMWEHIDPNEIAKLINMFPAELRELWPRLARAE